MSTEMILARLMREDALFAERLRRNMKLIEQDKKNLLNRADEYGQLHQQEIEEGTKKMQLLLTEGKARGLTEEEVVGSVGRFLPTRRTPILNMLYFMLREDTPQWLDIKKEFEARFGGIHEDYDMDESQLNKKYGHLEYEEKLTDSVKDIEPMDTFIYGNMSHATYKRIKKLKAISKCDNANEAFIAYRMCIQLCSKYNLEFDKVACDTD
jgi:hypothetical protein